MPHKMTEDERAAHAADIDLKKRAGSEKVERDDQLPDERQLGAWLSNEDSPRRGQKTAVEKEALDLSGLPERKQDHKLKKNVAGYAGNKASNKNKDKSPVMAGTGTPKRAKPSSGRGRREARRR